MRRVVGLPASDQPPRPADAEAPESLREVAFLDRINEVGPAKVLDGAGKLPRLYDEGYAVLVLSDRAGLVPRSLIARAVSPSRGANAISSPLTKLYRHGLIAQHRIGLVALRLEATMFRAVRALLGCVARGRGLVPGDRCRRSACPGACVRRDADWDLLV